MFEAFIQGLTQGLTEFIPVSSSGHLLFVQAIFNGSENKAFVAAIHAATFFAVLLYFGKDVLRIAKGFFSKNQNEDKKLGWNIIYATIPAVILGVIVTQIDALETFAASMFWVGVTSIIFALLLYYFDQKSTKSITASKQLSPLQSVVIGASQIIAAVFPGASRSGITLTTSFAFNVDRTLASRFVFLISIPITGLAAINELFIKQSVQINSDFIIAFIAAFVSGLLAIHYLLYFIRKASLKWLCAYRIAFGIVLIVFSLL